MSLTAFQRVRRLNRVEEMRPENIQAKQKEVKEAVEVKEAEVKVEEPVKEVKEEISEKEVKEEPKSETNRRRNRRS